MKTWPRDAIPPIFEGAQDALHSASATGEEYIIAIDASLSQTHDDTLYHGINNAIVKSSHNAIRSFTHALVAHNLLLPKITLAKERVTRAQGKLDITKLEFKSLELAYAAMKKAGLESLGHLQAVEK
ncbi:hypothetical protein ACHAP5_011613 [Fusarium lateritium]